MKTKVIIEAALLVAAVQAYSEPADHSWIEPYRLEQPTGYGLHFSQAAQLKAQQKYVGRQTPPAKTA